MFGVKEIVVVGLTLLTGGCGYYHVSKVKADAGFTDLSQATLSFEAIRSSVFAPYCIKCHSDAKGNRGGVNLETYANIKPAALQIRAAVASGSMPDDRALPAAQTELLFAWIDAGAPEISDLPVPGEGKQGTTPEPTPPSEKPPVPPVAKVTFEDVKNGLFVPLCVQCHAGFATFAKVVKRIGEIHDAITSGAMPKDGSPVAPELKQLLEDWIAQGTPEN